MKGILGVLVVVSLVGLPMLAAAETIPSQSVSAALAAALQDGKSCGKAVETLLLAGFPAADVIPAALASCKDCNQSEIVISAIKAGADPFTVAYVAKNAGVDLNSVANAPQGGPTSAATAAQADDEDTFVPPPAPVGVSSVPIVIQGGSSDWGESHWVASPSL
jgi:hypothetical protein